MQLIQHKIYKFLNWLLPIYKNIPFTPYEIAIWASEHDFKTMRITIRTRDGGLWRMTIKEGDYKDPKRISSYFFNEPK
jgi:hypothetical protein